MVRRLKADVLTELPPKVRSVLELEGDANARKAAKVELAKWQEFEGAIKAAQQARDEAAAKNDKLAYETAVLALRSWQCCLGTGMKGQACKKLQSTTYPPQRRFKRN